MWSNVRLDVASHLLLLISIGFGYFKFLKIQIFVYVIAREGVKFGINFTSCSENGK